MKLEQLKISGINEPVGYHLINPVLSWKVSDAQGKQPIFASIDVTKCNDDLNILFHKEGSDLDWEGTRLDLDLSPRTQYEVKVTVKDETGDYASRKTIFETGKMQEDWEGQWIGTAQEGIHPVFRKKFNIPNPISGKLYIAGLGLYEVYLNGEKVGDEFLTPYFNDYSEFVQVQTYDISSLLKKENILEVFLGKGWYSGRFGMDSQSSFEGFQLIAEMHIMDASGDEIIVASNETWEYRKSNIVSSGIYDGEIIDDLVNEDELEWKQAQIVSGNEKIGKLVDRYSLPVVKKMELPVKEIIYTPNGETVLDFGQNMAGWVVFESTLQAGEQLHLDFGEVFQNGNFYNDNYRSASGGFTYISDGQQKQVRPHFTYYGFRYVRVTGLEAEIHPQDFMAWVLYSDLDITGFIETDNEKINRLFQNCVWGQKANFVDIPSDCPQRDERLAWTGDAEIFAPSASYNMDTAAFFRKFLWMIRTAQKHKDGGVPAYVPEGAILCDCTAGWGDAATIIPSVLWDFYQNREMLKESYPMMKDWVDYVGHEIEKTNGQKYGLWTAGFQFGDWLALDGFSENEYKGSTPDEFVASMYYYNSLKLVSKAASILGMPETELYKSLEEKQKEYLLNEYFSPRGHLAVNTQTAYIMAINFEVYRDFDILVTDFVKQLRRDRYKICGGFAGGPILCQTLAKCGCGDLAYHFLLNEDYPGWLYEVNQGATTIWERWNSILPDGTMNPMGMNSLNHYSYGSVCEFMYKYMVGINPGDVGFRDAIISPIITPFIRHVNSVYDSVSGKYEIEYKLLDNGEIFIKVVVPFGCKATLVFPNADGRKINLDAGSYVETYMPTKDVRYMFDLDAFLSDVFKNPEAEAIVMKELGMAAMYRTPENAFRQIFDLYELIPMGVSPQAVDTVIGSLSQIRIY